MDVYTSENEQLEALQRWWQKNGRFVIAAVAAVLLGVFGWRQWQEYQESQAVAASNAYQQMTAQQDPAKIIEAGRALVADHPRSEYAVLASLAMGAAAVAQNDLDGAAAHLRFAMENGKMAGDRQVAALRLARVLLAQEKAKEAQQVVDSVPADGFEADFHEVRGDIALAQGDRAAARNAYQKALAGYAGQPTKSQTVKMKLDDLADAAGGNP